MKRDPFDYVCEGQMTFGDLEGVKLDTIKIGLALQSIIFTVDNATLERIKPQIQAIEDELIKYINEEAKNG